MVFIGVAIDKAGRIVIPKGVRDALDLQAGATTPNADESTLSGGLFRSEDGGDSWELNRPLCDPRREESFGGGADQPGIHSICVDPRDSRHVVLGVSCGGVWTMRDGGRTWQLGGKGVRGEPRCAVVQHHNGIFGSTDAAGSWTEIEGVKPSAFGFAVAVHPQDAGTAWFVPAIKDEKRYPSEGRVVVNRTRDGGKTFETLTKGLPQQHAHDLVFRHALDIDESGDRLVFGSTTGSLWITEDGGDSWSTLSSNLPPIYSVRFEKPN